MRCRDGKPNLLLIVADDLGWSDLGAFGGEIETPNLDELALSGVRLTGFHTSPACSPTRAMLLSGVDNHAAGLGRMAEELTPEFHDLPGYEGYLNDRVACIAELLQAGGYRTLMAGKWHLGLTRNQSPAARGFDHSYALLEGVANHFGGDQSSAWHQVERATYRYGFEEVRYPRGAYSTDLFTDQMLDFLTDPRDQERPFFAYLAFTAPHWPLQAPAAEIAKYRAVYDAGPECLREERLWRQRQLGLVTPDTAAHALVGITPWHQLTSTERQVAARRMEVYAAMVDRLDQNVGRLLEALHAAGQLENTLIFFLSDNGPEGGLIEAPSGAADPRTLRALGIDNSLENIGAATSYVGYGPGWAQASSAPSWLMKGFTTQGGIRTPAFASGAQISGDGRISHAFVHVTDVAPTLLAAAGLKQPAALRGRAILEHAGHSLLPLLTGQVDHVRTENEAVSWELSNERAVRLGRWKAVYIAPGRSKDLPAEDLESQGSGRWQLFDLATDPGETTDLAGRHPAILGELMRDWSRYVKEKGVVPPSDRDGRIRVLQRP